MPRLDNENSFVNASIDTIMAKARAVVENEVKKSALFDASTEETIPRFDVKEIKMGRVVGRGGFCVVRELMEIRLRPNEIASDAAAVSGKSAHSESALSRWKQRQFSSGQSSFGTSRSSTRNVDPLDLSSRRSLARRVWTKQGGKYVVKQVESSLINSDKVTFLKAVIDFALETKFLANLNHPHILKLRGYCSDSPYESAHSFLVLEFLPDTLPKRLNAWMHTHRATKGITGFVTGSKRKVTELMTERLMVAYDIAAAGEYLHSKSVIFRDLKPDNIGFDTNGVTKLMDFGLAKEVSNEEMDENGLYHLTGLTGGIRYMAPEVGLGLPYNMKADIYSWSMIMWYIIALEPPMGLYTPKMLLDRVFSRGYRPATKDKWSPPLCQLMKISWSSDLNERPCFGEIMEELRKEVNAIDPKVAALMDIASEGEFGS